MKCRKELGYPPNLPQSVPSCFFHVNGLRKIHVGGTRGQPRHLEADEDGIELSSADVLDSPASAAAKKQKKKGRGGVLRKVPSLPSPPLHLLYFF